MQRSNLPRDLGVWASDAVTWYRRVCLWPELGNTHETIVRMHLLQKLAEAGFLVRIEVAEEALSRATRAGHPGNLSGNRGGTDIVIGRDGRVAALIEVKRGFPENAGDMARVVQDVRRLKALHEEGSDLQLYVVVVLGAAWSQRSYRQVQDGLKRWHDRFGAAIVFVEDAAGSAEESARDCWATVVVDAVRAVI